MATKAEIIAQVIATYVSNDIGAVTAPILRNTLLEILNCEDLGPGIGDATAEINAILESIFGVSDGDLDNSYVVGVPSTLTQLIKSTVLSAFGRTVTASADAAALRAILELGTAAQNDTANFELAGSIASALVAYYNKTQVDALLAAIPTFNDTYELVTSVDLTGTLPNSRVLVNSDSIQVVFDAAGKVSFNFIGTGTEPVTVSDQYLDDVKSLSNINRNIASPGSGHFRCVYSSHW